MAKSYSISVDGVDRTLEVDDPNMPLLYALRDELGMKNPRFGCGLGQCGACTVHIDGQPTRSCVTPLSAISSSKIITLAGIGSQCFITDNSFQKKRAVRQHHPQVQGGTRRQYQG